MDRETPDDNAIFLLPQDAIQLMAAGLINVVSDGGSDGLEKHRLWRYPRLRPPRFQILCASFKGVLQASQDLRRNQTESQRRPEVRKISTFR